MCTSPFNKYPPFAESLHGDKERERSPNQSREWPGETAGGRGAAKHQRPALRGHPLYKRRSAQIEDSPECPGQKKTTTTHPHTMVYSYDDQYNVLIKSATNLSSSHHSLSDFAAIDYFQFEFSELQLHNCWKLVHRQQRVNETFIPLSTDVTRLENLSWRRWTKMKYALTEVTPESVDWYKDCDITWLYGPLVSGHSSEEDFGFSKLKATATHKTLNIPTRRNGSVTSLSSTSSVESSPFYSDTSDEEDELMDEKSCKDVKPILKHRFSYGPLGLENFEKLRKHKVGSTECFKKSVSFADMVQIRQF